MLTKVCSLFTPQVARQQSDSGRDLFVESKGGLVNVKNWWNDDGSARVDECSQHKTQSGCDSENSWYWDACRWEEGNAAEPNRIVETWNFHALASADIVWGTADN